MSTREKKDVEGYHCNNIAFGGIDLFDLLEGKFENLGFNKHILSFQL